jgi:hypothetical protein
MFGLIDFNHSIEFPLLALNHDVPMKNLVLVPLHGDLASGFYFHPNLILKQNSFIIFLANKVYFSFSNHYNLLPESEYFPISLNLLLFSHYFLFPHYLLKMVLS